MPRAQHERRIDLKAAHADAARLYPSPQGSAGRRISRRSASLEVLRNEIAARRASRRRIQAKSNRRFATDGACAKLKRLGPTLAQ